MQICVPCSVENTESLEYTNAMKSVPDDLKTALGQCFWIGLNGTDARDSATREIFRTFQPGGVILFQRNVKSIAQVRKMNSDLQSMSSIPLFTAIDQEGGSVERLHEIIGTIPPAMALAAAHDPKLARDVHGAHARILRALGFNVDFTPVLDLAVSKADNGLGTRCFSDDPRTVIRYAEAVTAAFRSEGILVCGKHFPGLGDTDLDSHLDLPTVPRRWSRIESEDLLPYRALLPHLPFIMVNHALYPDRNSRMPASLAPQIVSNFLLREWNYSGLAISDDLIMGAVSRFYNLTEAAERALLAGNHMFLICRPEGVVQTYRRLLSLLHSDTKLKQAVHSAASRILAFKFQRLKRESGRTSLNSDRKTMERASEQISRKAITLVRGRRPSRMPAQLDVFLPRTKWLKSRHSAMRRALARHGSRAAEHFYDIQLQEKEGATLASASRRDWNIVVTTSMSTHPGQKALVRELLRAGKRLILVHGFFPNDWRPEQAQLVLAAYWTAPAALRAAADAIAGTLVPRGRMPLKASLEG